MHHFHNNELFLAVAVKMICLELQTTENLINSEVKCCSHYVFLFIDSFLSQLVFSSLVV